MRLDLMQTALSQFDQRHAADQERDPAIAVRAGRRHSDAGPDATPKACSISSLGMLNTGGRRPLPVFRPQPSTRCRSQTSDHILNGDGLQGRPQADHRRAQAGRSRHQRPRPADRRAPTGTAVSLTEDAGRRSASSSSAPPRTISGATVTAPSGSPPVDVGRSRRDQSERRRHRQVHASRCRTAPRAT